MTFSDNPRHHRDRPVTPYNRTGPDQPMSTEDNKQTPTELLANAKAIAGDIDAQVRAGNGLQAAFQLRGPILSLCTAVSQIVEAVQPTIVSVSGLVDDAVPLDPEDYDGQFDIIDEPPTFEEQVSSALEALEHAIECIPRFAVVSQSEHGHTLKPTPIEAAGVQVGSRAPMVHEGVRFDRMKEMLEPIFALRELISTSGSEAPSRSEAEARAEESADGSVDYSHPTFGYPVPDAPQA